jgi:hypothetical protein
VSRSPPAHPGAYASPTNYAACSSMTHSKAGSPRALGVSRQTILQRVKRGELQAVLTRTGRRKGLRIKVPNHKTNYFDHDNQRTEQYDHASKHASMSASSTQ